MRFESLDAQEGALSAEVIIRCDGEEVGRIMLNRDRIERLGLHLAELLDSWMLEAKDLPK